MSQQGITDEGLYEKFKWLHAFTPVAGKKSPQTLIAHAASSELKRQDYSDQLIELLLRTGPQWSSKPLRARIFELIVPRPSTLARPAQHFEEAVRQETPEVVQMFLRRGFNPDKLYTGPLFSVKEIALLCRGSNIHQVLEEFGFDIRIRRIDPEKPRGEEFTAAYGVGFIGAASISAMFGPVRVCGNNTPTSRIINQVASGSNRSQKATKKDLYLRARVLLSQSFRSA